MATSHQKGKPRSVFSTANKYQDRIILLTFLPSTFIFISFMSIVFICNPNISMPLVHHSFPGLERLITRFSAVLVFMIFSIFFLAVAASFHISNNLVGAFGRIERELDDIISGRSQKPITCRPSDDLAGDLLKRINVLVSYYIEHKQAEKNQGTPLVQSKEDEKQKP